MGSVSVLFSDKFTTMANNLGLLESDHENLSQEDGQSHTLDSIRRPNSHLSRDLHLSGSDHEDEEADDEDLREEQGSPQ